MHDVDVDDLLTLKKRGPVKRLMLWLPAAVTPNQITMLGVVLCGVMAWQMLRGLYWASLVTYILATACDFFDGALYNARKEAGRPLPTAPTTLWQMLTSGEFLDPLADKIRTWSPPVVFFTQLIVPFQVVVVIGMLVAYALTHIRVRKYLRATSSTGEMVTKKAPSVVATTPGKWKAFPETAAVLAILIWAISRVEPLQWFGAITMASSIYFAFGSLKNQIVSPT